MNAHEQHEIAEKIVRRLDRGSRNISSEASARLTAAREQALARYQQVPEMGLSGVGHYISHMFGRPATGARYAISLAVLILGLAGIVYWQSSNGAGNELTDLDVRLLTDDLPIDAYLDKGFDTWLKRQSR
jgi:hypothetical protein